MEKNKKNILFLFLLLFALSFDTVAQIKDVPVVKLFEKEYYKYEIKAHESLYSICKKFNVTEAEILSINPFIVDGLKTGQTLMIPVKALKNSAEASKKPVEKEMIITNDDTPVSIITDKKKQKKKAVRTIEKSRITVFLPFALSTTPGINDRYIEFYEGLLLAVDSLKSLGLSFEVQALESGLDTEGINQAIISGKLKETDYCIGGTTPEQISLLAQWAKMNQRILILPFNSRIPEMDNNPYLFQTNMPHSIMYDRIAEYSIKQIDNANVIFLNSAIDESDVRSLLIPKIKSRLQRKGITFTDITADDQLNGLSKAVVDNLENVVIPTPLTLSETNQLVTRLSGFVNDNPEKKITLLGYPDWQAMNKSNQKRLYELNTYIFSNFYADAQKQNVRDFQIQFTETFGKSMINTYPKYAMMGYDIAAYFIPRMIFEKSENMGRTPKIAALQNDFQFSAKNPIGGAFNQIFYIIHYNRDYTVEVLPLN